MNRKNKSKTSTAVEIQSIYDFLKVILHKDGAKTYETLHYGLLTIYDPELVKWVDAVIEGKATIVDVCDYCRGNSYEEFQTAYKILN